MSSYFIPPRNFIAQSRWEAAMKRVKSPQLYVLAKDEILSYIHENDLTVGDLLPPESHFVSRLGISRGTLREAMRVLEEEGVVKRKQGIGTLICDATNPIRSTLDINESVSEMILGKGMKPGSKDTKIEKIQADTELAQRLNLNVDIPLISLTRVRTADEIPVAYTVDFLPLGIVPETFFQDFACGSLYTYMEERLGIELTNSMLQIQPIKAPKSIAQSLDIRPGTLLMLLKQTDTNTSNKPVLYSEEYFVADRFAFTVYRRRKRSL
jgi:GntR family transcriptional regulator